MFEWNVSEIQDSKTICFDEDGLLKPITEQIIIKMKQVGVIELNDNTAEEFLIRCEVVADVLGAPLRTNGSPTRINILDVVQHLGLKIEAESLSPPRFYVKVGKYMRKHAEDSVNEQKEIINPSS